MLTNLFKSKKSKKITGPVNLFNADGEIIFTGTPSDIEQLVRYKALYPALEAQLAEQKKLMMDYGDERIDLLQTVDRLEAENSRLGNSLFEILKNDTPRSNGTVKRIMALAKSALFQ